MINTHEKESIEKQVAEEFLLLFNQKFKTNFVVEEHRDKPDFFCIDKASNQELLLEITLLEDVKGDLRFILGRGEKPMPKGRAKGFYPATSFNDDTLVQIIERIKDKSMKDYGSNVALVIRQATSIPWDWNVELEVIRSKIHDLNNPFDKGRWILSSFGNIYCID